MTRHEAYMLIPSLFKIYATRYHTIFPLLAAG